jgi:hypothetical protein
MGKHFATRSRTVDTVDHNRAHELLFRSSMIIASLGMALLCAL